MEYANLNIASTLIQDISLGYEILPYSHGSYYQNERSDLNDWAKSSNMEEEVLHDKDFAASSEFAIGSEERVDNQTLDLNVVVRTAGATYLNSDEAIGNPTYIGQKKISDNSQIDSEAGPLLSTADTTNGEIQHQEACAVSSLDSTCSIEEIYWFVEIDEQTAADIKDVLKEIQPKKYQNLRRNIPGLILQRVKTSCLSCINPKKSLKKFKADYLRSILSHEVIAKDVQSFKSFLKQFVVKKKTWENFQENLKRKSEEHRNIFIDCIKAFLSQEGAEDFENWLRSPKMGDATRTILQAEKDELKDRFAQYKL